MGAGRIRRPPGAGRHGPPGGRSGSRRPVGPSGPPGSGVRTVLSLVSLSGSAGGGVPSSCRSGRMAPRRFTAQPGCVGRAVEPARHIRAEWC
ncbi:hypothetical protein ACFFX0_09175 [Citricoccus parietis]|uniref:Uncharacterized protein n=1 Tax=Citricoccus parietis TaxID=592307 RepID=A0ABV5FXD6_9MICC